MATGQGTLQPPGGGEGARPCSPLDISLGPSELRGTHLCGFRAPSCGHLLHQPRTPTGTASRGAALGTGDSRVTARPMLPGHSVRNGDECNQILDNHIGRTGERKPAASTCPYLGTSLSWGSPQVASEQLQCSLPDLVAGSPRSSGVTMEAALGREALGLGARGGAGDPLSSSYTCHHGAS